MPVPKIRIATIGTWGHLGDPIAELLPRSDIEFVAHGRATAEDEISFVRKLVGTSALPWFDDYHQLLREVRPDVVILSTRVDRINPIAIDVAKAGCHLISEKPLAIYHDDLRKLHDAVRCAGVQTIAMLGTGRHPVMQAAAGIIASGKAGEITLVNARKSYRWGGSRPEWFGSRAVYGGSIPWIAIHALEMIHVLTKKEFVSVSAMQSNAAHPERPDCEDNGLLLLELIDGGRASVSFDFLRPNAASTHGDDWVRLVGTEGVIEAALDRGWCKFTSQHAGEHEVALPARAKYYDQLLNAIRDGERLLMPASRRSFMLTHAALCARDAADQKALLPIPLIY